MILIFLPSRSKNGWWGEPVQFFVQHINNCQSFDGSPIQNGSICALPRRTGRTQLRAVQKLSEGPYVETETYPKEMEMSAAVPFLRHLAAISWIHRKTRHISKPDDNETIKTKNVSKKRVRKDQRH